MVNKLLNNNMGCSWHKEIQGAIKLFNNNFVQHMLTSSQLCTGTTAFILNDHKFSELL